MPGITSALLRKRKGIRKMRINPPGSLRSEAPYLRDRVDTEGGVRSLDETQGNSEGGLNRTETGGGEVSVKFSQATSPGSLCSVLVYCTSVPVQSFLCQMLDNAGFWQWLFIYYVLIPEQAITRSGKMVFILNILVCCYQRYGLPD